MSGSAHSDKPLRLDKYVASVTDLSRSDVKKRIKAGDVEVDGRVLTNPAELVPADAELTLDGQWLRRALPRYFMLHKPPGFVSATRDKWHPTVMELLHEDNIEQLHIAGRLDVDTTGLLLITDDGQWAHQVMSPKSECFKRYHVLTESDIPANAAERFERGLFLDEEQRRTLPAKLEMVAPREAWVEICEGKFHQVKRMFAALDNRVIGLHRQSIGALVLDEALAEGEYRALTDDEVRMAVGDV